MRELAWQSIEPNTFGTDEFITLCRKLDWTPMLTVNLGTGTPEEARNWVEYCNCLPGTKYADMRVVNGNTNPYGVDLWCLGNEMDGHWQLGHVPASEYAIRAQQAAKMMRDVDKTIELVACGSCSTDMFETYMEWDRQVLEYLGDYADYISLHRYVGNRNDDTLDYLAVTNSIDQQIEEMDAVCQFVQAKRRSKKRAYLCFDEWNVWYKNHEVDGEGKFAPHLVEEVYNLEDALVVAGFLHSFIRHADVVKIANIAQIVNVIAPILTRGDDMLVQASYYPIEMFAKRRDGISLQPVVDGPSYESTSYGTASYIDTSAILDGQTMHLFFTNRSLEESAEINVKLSNGAIGHIDNAEILTGSDPKAANSFEQPDLIKAERFTEASVTDGQVVGKLPPMSVVAMTVQLSDA
jgi:alpha-N-arabinofuranosidase